MNDPFDPRSMLLGGLQSAAPAVDAYKQKQEQERPLSQWEQYEAAVRMGELEPKYAAVAMHNGIPVDEAKRMQPGLGSQVGPPGVLSAAPGSVPAAPQNRINPLGAPSGGLQGGGAMPRPVMPQNARDLNALRQWSDSKRQIEALRGQNRKEVAETTSKGRVEAAETRADAQVEAAGVTGKSRVEAAGVTAKTSAQNNAATNRTRKEIAGANIKSREKVAAANVELGYARIEQYMRRTEELARQGVDKNLVAEMRAVGAQLNQLERDRAEIQKQYSMSPIASQKLLDDKERQILLLRPKFEQYEALAARQRGLPPQPLPAAPRTTNDYLQLDKQKAKDPLEGVTGPAAVRDEVVRKRSTTEERKPAGARPASGSSWLEKQRAKQKQQ